MRTNEQTMARIENWIDAHKDEMVADLQAFSRIRSVSRADLAAPGAPFGAEVRQMMDYALQKGREYGMETADHDGYCISVYSGDLNNAIGIFGHLDVVPEGDNWIYPPYDATRVGDFLIGRGVGDNKSACVLGLSILRMMRDLDFAPRHGIRVVMGGSEETGMQDMQHFAKTQTMPVISFVPDAGFPVNYAQKGTLRGVISIPLPTSVVRFVGGQVENMVPPSAEVVLDLPVDRVKECFASLMNASSFDITGDEAQTTIFAHGAAAHAASPESGISAIHMLAAALADCPALTDDARKTLRAISEMSGDFYGNTAGIGCEDPETGKTTMVIGVAKTKDGRITLTMDCRLSIATDLDDVQTAYRAYADKLGFAVESLSAGAPFYMPKDDPRVMALMEVYRELTGDESPAYTMGGGTYSRCLKNALTYGPGFGEGSPRPDLPEHHGGAHAPDEYIYLPDLFRALKVYAVSILELDEIV